MKNEFIFNARELHKYDFSKTNYKYWVMKYLNGMNENLDFIISYVKSNKNGKPRITHFLNEKAKIIIEEKMKTPFSIYGYKCPISKEIKYVGCSINEYLRMNQIYYNEGNSSKMEWALYLKDRGLKPELIILDVASSVKEASIKEQQQIKIHSSTILNSNTLSIYKSRFNKLFKTYKSNHL